MCYGRSTSTRFRIVVTVSLLLGIATSCSTPPTTWIPSQVIATGPTFQTCQAVCTTHGMQVVASLPNTAYTYPISQQLLSASNIKKYYAVCRRKSPNSDPGKQAIPGPGVCQPYQLESGTVVPFDCLCQT
jgi:hypothetical protein